MMNELKTSSTVSGATSRQKQNRAAGSPGPVFDIKAVSVILAFPAMLAVWYMLDNSWPFWDGASHLLDSMHYKELLSSPSIFKASWWHEFLTVNYCYPPQMHLFLGCLFLVFPKSIIPIEIAQVVFLLLMSASIFYLSYKLLGSRKVASLSVVILNSFPLVIENSHSAYLDFASLALCLLALCFLVRWQENKSWQNCMLLGVFLGIAASSKQLASCFLLFPCIAAMVCVIREKNWLFVRQIVTSGLIALSALLVWLIPNFEEIRAFTQRPCPFKENPDFTEVLLENARGYLLQAGDNISPFLLGVLILSAFMMPSDTCRKANLLIFSACGALFFFTISYNNPEPRYIFPVLALFAVLIAVAVERLLDRPFLKAFGFLIVFVALLQYFTFSFTPYPVQGPDFVTRIPEVLGIKKASLTSYFPCAHPTPPGDCWGQEWVIDTIRSVNKNVPEYLFVVPNDPHFNVHTFNLIAALKDMNLKATTSRLWTLNGDDISFDADHLKHYQWYLLKKNNKTERPERYKPQEAPKDEKSEFALRCIENTIRKNSELVASRRLLDGTDLEIYKRK